MIVDLIEALYRLLWGDLFTLPVAGGIGISFMVVLLFAAGIGFTLRTRLLPVRLFRDMIGAVCEKKQAAGGLSSDRKSTRLNSSHNVASRMPSSA